MIRHYCDRCNKEIDINATIGNIENGEPTYKQIYICNSQYVEMDAFKVRSLKDAFLCHKCYDGLVDYLKPLKGNEDEESQLCDDGVSEWDDIIVDTDMGMMVGFEPPRTWD